MPTFQAYPTRKTVGSRRTRKNLRKSTFVVNQGAQKALNKKRKDEAQAKSKATEKV